MSWKSMEEMYNYFGDCVDGKEFEKEKKEIEEFLDGCEDYEFYEDILYGECFIIRKENEYFVVSGNWDSFKFEKMDDDEIKMLK